MKIAEVEGQPAMMSPWAARRARQRAAAARRPRVQKQFEMLQAELVDTKGTNSTVAKLYSQVKDLEQARNETLQQTKRHAKEQQEQIQMLQAELSQQGETIKYFVTMVAELRSQVEDLEQARDETLQQTKRHAKEQ